MRSSIQQLDRISNWRIRTLHELLSERFILHDLTVVVSHVLLSGDNEYLCKELGIPGGKHYTTLSASLFLIHPF